MSRIRTIIQGRLPSLDAAKVSTAQIELAAVVRRTATARVWEGEYRSELAISRRLTQVSHEFSCLW
jgi:hypothetical protein